MVVRDAPRANAVLSDAALKLAQGTLEDRTAMAKTIVETFVLDTAPKQVCLSSTNMARLVDAYQALDADRSARERLLAAFKPALDELFRELRVSKEFHDFELNEKARVLQEEGEAKTERASVVSATDASGVVPENI